MVLPREVHRQVLYGIQVLPDHHPSQRRNSVKWIKSKMVIHRSGHSSCTLIDPVQQCVAACIDSRSGSEIFFTTRCSPSVISGHYGHSFHPSDVQCQLYPKGDGQKTESHRRFYFSLECGYRKLGRVAAVAEWYRYRTVACFVTGSSPVPLKIRRVGQRCTLNLSRAETSSRWCGVVVRRGEVPAQVSSTSLDHGSKLRGPSPEALV
ncbi:uncharacterized protein TNCV_2166041 [Trichonephila clavipes]|nr:uncharacterized protein TNCV_2166041 [Trichonephila clavipes]